MPSRNRKKRYLQKQDDILSQENKAKARARYKADPEKKKASVRDSYKADPKKKKASVRDSYKVDPEKKKASVRDSYKADPEKKKASVLVLLFQRQFTERLELCLGSGTVV